MVDKHIDSPVGRFHHETMIESLFQVQHYVPKTRVKYEPLPENIEAFFSKDVSELVSDKLPGYQVNIYSTSQKQQSHR